MVDYLANLADKFPILSIEDGMSEDDFEGWKLLTDKLGKKVQLVGDDLFVTNPKRLQLGLDKGLANSDPDQGQPDRHAVGDHRRRRSGPPQRLHQRR